MNERDKLKHTLFRQFATFMDLEQAGRVASWVLADRAKQRYAAVAENLDWLADRYDSFTPSNLRKQAAGLRAALDKHNIPSVPSSITVKPSGGMDDQVQIQEAIDTLDNQTKERKDGDE